MSTISNLLVAAQVYGGQSPAARARRDAATSSEFTVDLTARSKDRQAATPTQPFNPTLAAPSTPKPLEPAKRFDEGAGRRDALPPQQNTPERLERPGARLNILV